MKMLFLSAAALAALVAVPVLANPDATTETEVVEKHRIVMKTVNRADMIRKVQEHFAKLDSDNDGFVTKAEAEAAKDRMRERFVEKRVEKHGEGMFERMDKDNDGSISRSEFDSVREERVEKIREGGHVMKRVHMVRIAMHGRLFEMADADKDGRVSLQEATTAAASHFDRMDTNRDGTLSVEEMRAAHGKHVGKPGT